MAETPNMDAISREELAAALKEAINPLLIETREMRQDISRLQLSAASRSDVYDKAVMDEKLSALQAGVLAVEVAIKANKDFTWKVLGGVGTLMVVLVNLAPHISFR